MFYFPRIQGFTCIPSEGGSTLGNYEDIEIGIEINTIHLLSLNNRQFYANLEYKFIYILTVWLSHYLVLLIEMKNYDETDEFHEIHVPVIIYFKY